MACGCSSGGGGCSRKANPLGANSRLERYKLKEIIRKLKPVALQISRVTQIPMEKVYENQLRLPLREALLHEMEALEEEVDLQEVSDHFDEDFQYALDVFLGKVVIEKKEKDDTPDLDCKILLQVCNGPSCERRGSGEVLAAVQEELAIEVGETTADGVFGLVEATCFRQCRQGPNLKRNDVAFQEVDPTRVAEYVDKAGLERAAQFRVKMEAPTAPSPSPTGFG